MLAMVIPIDVYPYFVKERKVLIVFCVVFLVAVIVAGIWLREYRTDSGSERSGEEGEAAAPSPSRQGSDFEDLAFDNRSAEKTESVPHLESVQIRHLESVSKEDDHSHALGLWLGTLDPPPNEWNAQSVNDLGSLELQLTTPDGEVHYLKFDRFMSLDSRKGTYLGAIRSSSTSQAVFSYVNDAVVATVRLPERNIAWEIRNQGDGVQLFEKVDLSQLKTCKVCRDE